MLQSNFTIHNILIAGINVIVNINTHINRVLKQVLLILDYVMYFQLNYKYVLLTATNIKDFSIFSQCKRIYKYLHLSQ